MAGLMSRASLIVKSKFSKLLNRAENPTETLDYSYEQMLQQLQNVKRGVADVVTAKKRLELQTQKREQNVVKLETQARQAVAANREDLARQALERKAAAQQQLQGLDAQVQQLEDQQQKLVAGEQALQTKIEAFRTQKEVIKAQYSAAEAQVKIGEAATGIGEHMADIGLAVQRAQDKTQQMQARGAALDEPTGGFQRLVEAAANGEDARSQRTGLDQLSVGRTLGDEHDRREPRASGSVTGMGLGHVPVAPDPLRHPPLFIVSFEYQVLSPYQVHLSNNVLGAPKFARSKEKSGRSL